ncbi:MAG: DUF1778 domain-containing protein [Nitrospirae bacterium]|nr:DUF1778 domain-containing protein [Nitrospirota bacterium]
MSARAVRTEKLDLRLSPTAKRRLEAAASVASRSLSAFVLESALSQADQTLADRQTFVLSKTKWSEFQQALDAPIRPLPRLQRLLTEPGFFDAVPASTEKR